MVYATWGRVWNTGGKNTNSQPSRLFHSHGYEIWKKGNESLWDFFGLDIMKEVLHLRI